ncbi:MAG: AAA family ATPase [Sideroxydans sp.]|nr:AAA family ATPase [Sideroxydans sp.]
MYLEHFGLNEPPFKITPITDFFFSGSNRGEILDALVYAISSSEGIIKITGEVGSGKTMLCRMLLERLPSQVEPVYLANPSLSREEMLYAIADGLGLDLEGQRVNVILQTLQSLLQQKTRDGKRVVILVDEAHAMPLDTLEELRLLYNLQAGDQKLLQIVLFGQPELNEKLDQPNMRQLKDRIVHHFTMLPLSKNAIASYLMFRMRAAGYRGPDIFSANAVKLIGSASHGLMRRVNILADKALLAAFVANTHQIDVRHVQAAIRDSELAPKQRNPKNIAVMGGIALATLVLAVIGWPLVGHLAAPKNSHAALQPASEQAAAPAMATPPASAVAPVAVSAIAAAPTKPAATRAAQRVPAKPSVKAPRKAAAQTMPPLLRQRLDAAQEMLAKRSKNDTSIQLYYTEDVRPARMERFLERARKLGKLQEIYVLPIKIKGHDGFRVLYGNYPSIEAARTDVQHLPKRYKEAFAPTLYMSETAQATR